jgi:hypothetical protein
MIGCELIDCLASKIGIGVFRGDGSFIDIVIVLLLLR